MHEILNAHDTGSQKPVVSTSSKQATPEVHSDTSYCFCTL